MPTFIEVCAGAGGLSSGLINAGFIPLLLNDKNKDCCLTLQKNHFVYKNVVKCDDINSLNFENYKDLDLLAGGIPCQSYSHSGKREGLEDPRGQLLYIFIKIINTLKPKIFLIENVKGMTTHNKGETLKKIISLFNPDEYNIDYKVLNAFDYSVPQKRERLFIVGAIKTLPKFKFPECHKNKIVLKNILVDIPKSPCAKYSQKKIELFKLIPQGGCWINLPIDKQKELTHLNVNERNTNISIKCIDDTPSNQIKAFWDIENKYIDNTQNLSSRSYMTLKIMPILSDETQKELIKKFNNYLDTQRKKYNSMFLTNYRNNSRKRISFALVYQILNYLIANQ